jgi:hypothetical protein
MPRHQHHAPPAIEPLRAARLLAALHEPPRIRRRRRSTVGAAAVIVIMTALLSVSAWTLMTSIVIGR